ncbi:hypothetical protein [Dyadobacter sp. CY326]|uniref:hypothetical protein n=1 Tax=Dyadobacter sp. CY326 TaxID=2907300 RepID=UPI001F373A34|nr:hypothetical protein [Dyadobacter sp. CY326]MCE7064198.1 hypothetical protein [Dyadobacter sp. CY326]
MKKNKPKSNLSTNNSSPDTEPILSSDSEALAAKETDDNLEKLAKKLTEEWNKPVKAGKTPDLSFAKFAERLPKKDQ